MSSTQLDLLLADIKEAMKKRESDKITALRTLHAQIKDVGVNAGKDITDDLVATVIAKAIKQRKESIEQYEQAGREDLAAKEQQEIEYFIKYQPEQLTETEIEKIVVDAIAQRRVQLESKI